jgi:hypothetical protein
MQDVQGGVDNGVATTPRGQLVDARGLPMIRVADTVELREALNSLAALGVRRVGYRFRFYDDGDVTWEFAARRGGGRDQRGMPAFKAARYHLGELLEAAIREATEEFMDLGRELHFECFASVDPGTSMWHLSGRGTVFEMYSGLEDVGITLK